MSFSAYRYLLMTTDPVHIGTGGMRLGRVDNSIVRELGTRLPKIPGTSLSGAIRSYAAYRYGKRSCAGKDGHCGSPTCPICYTFGSVRGGGSEQSYSGVVSIGDARLLLFPVYSMAGPVWVTSPSALEDFGIKDQSVENNKAKWCRAITSQKHLNLGWLMVEKDGDDWSTPTELANKSLPGPACNRIVLISDKLFSHVVNSNLEVRTSVAINPETGAAEDKALFTYEAIPRAAFMWMDAVIDDYRNAFPGKERLEKWLRKKGKDFGIDERPNRQDLAKWKNETAGAALGLYCKGNNTWNSPTDVITAGLEWAEHLGIGGMGTRGFGRIRVIKSIQSQSHAQPGEGRANAG
ncbi:MAG: type III-B CRISPR module RAMP protein Cmr4 [Methanotrichaceae archaeon]|nr:type III-B CRISPR module RAMP protein Cmr4 [Methanotrichaceae archaeon]